MIKIIEEIEKVDRLLSNLKFISTESNTYGTSNFHADFNRDLNYDFRYNQTGPQ
jgi:hypothetical protein